MPHTPRNYQVVGITWLTEPNVDSTWRQPIGAYNHVHDPAHTHDSLYTPDLVRKILADAPGAGKTIQSSEAACSLTSNNQSVLVITPAHLVEQWFKDLSNQYPDAPIVSIDGPKQKRLKQLKYKAKFIICPLQSLRRQDFVDALAQCVILNHVQVCIIDESHYVKARDSKQSKAVQQLVRPDFIPHVIMLSATPISREADDLFQQMRILDPHVNSNFDKWLNEYCWYTYTQFGPQQVSLKHKKADQLSHWMMGRTYEQIGLELPPLIDTEHDVNLLPQRRKVYDDLHAYWVAQVEEVGTLHADSAMEVMHTLRHITASPEKLALLQSYLDTDPGPYLIGCWYRASAHEVVNSIKASHPHLNPVAITGEIQPATARIALAKSLNNPNDVIVATIPSISEGVDLSHCNTLYYYEQDWTPGKMHQFESRTHRHRDNTNTPDDLTIQEPTKPGEFSTIHIPQDPNERPIILRYLHVAKSIDKHVHAVRNNRAVNIKDIIKAELGV